MKPPEVHLPDHPKYDYLRRQIARVGDRDPIEILEQTPRQLVELVERFDDEHFAARPAADTWSAREILAHLADCEWLFGQRIRSVFGDRSPTLFEADQNRWLTEQRANERPTTEWLEDFLALRPLNIRFWQRLEPAHFDRSGHHDGADMDMPLSFILPLQAGHDLSHLEQMTERLQAAG